MSNTNYETMLDWPIERQQQEADREGLSLEDWQKREREWLDMMQESSDKFQWGVRPEGWTDEDAKRWQAKVDSSQPGEIYDPFK